MDNLQKLMTAFELHSVAGIKECFENGIDPSLVYNGKPIIDDLINMYTRGPAFKDCIKTFVENGVEFEDKALLAVLSDDAATLDNLLVSNKALLTKHYSLDCTFTPIYEASLLHISAEYNHLACAEMLVQHGADIDAKAGFDENGFGGQTPIFHTVNQDANKCIDVMNFLISKNADLSLTINGIIWGKGYSWETFIPAINPISYAMMGLLRQFQRTEQQIYEVVSLLLKAAYGVDYTPPNIPNKYLNE
ncbi:ankyrin repeat domain-containing protein [Flavihumibacter fluvii]|uniref:ankyrin repeat domain-containing protein n=1 Tax=Flavihumibacter fluvii TaxID=2838157 RepID=UPI001BDEA97E|nr:ankyrin repeat domain-containing protein [Flavihumibacter fluvii]ULQ54131.1 ankyrin repeat domain-containing protein [Flavihumibacter fluvii]